MFSAALSASTHGGEPGLTWLVGLAAIMSAISLYYYLSILKQAFVKESTEAGEETSITVSHALAVGIPAVALVVLGLFPALLLEPITAAVIDSIGK
jgi:NADH-quinone oxidoreductase subunit N